jgi:hypothetical protein
MNKRALDAEGVMFGNPAGVPRHRQEIRTLRVIQVQTGTDGEA